MQVDLCSNNTSDYSDADPSVVLSSLDTPEYLHAIPEHARQIVRVILDGKIEFDYVDVLSDQTVRIGRYPEGYQMPDAPGNASVTVSESEEDLFLIWQGRF